MKKIAIISSHPIQYNAPFYALLSKVPEIDLMVFYTWGEAAKGQKLDPDFGKVIEWDIPLLEGYNFTFLKNTSDNPGSHHFKGIINPSIIYDIEAWSPDVLWIWGWAFDSHLKALRYFKGKLPIWFRGDSNLQDEPKGFSFKKLARRVFLKWVYKNVDTAFYVGTLNKNYFQSHNLKPNQLVSAPHAIDNKHFSVEKDEYPQLLNELRIKLDIKEIDTVFLFAGKLEPKKNPFFLLELAKHFKEENFKFLIVGNGQLEKALQLASASDNRIKFLDFQNQSMMPVLYRLASFFVLPSTGPGETWGLALNEALASGRPFIASTKCGGAIDLYNSLNGYLVNLQHIDFKDLDAWIRKFNIDEFQKQNYSFFECFNYNNFIKQVIININ